MRRAPGLNSTPVPRRTEVHAATRPQPSACRLPPGPHPSRHDPHSASGSLCEARRQLASASICISAPNLRARRSRPHKTYADPKERKKKRAQSSEHSQENPAPKRTSRGFHAHARSAILAMHSRSPRISVILGHETCIARDPRLSGGLLGVVVRRSGLRSPPRELFSVTRSRRQLWAESVSRTPREGVGQSARFWWPRDHLASPGFRALQTKRRRKARGVL